MKKTLITLAFASLSFVLSAQSIVKKGSDGNYSFISKDTTKQYVANGLYLLDKDGSKLVVYATRKGKEFVFATSKKTGKTSRKYIALQKYSTVKN